MMNQLVSKTLPTVAKVGYLFLKEGENKWKLQQVWSKS